MIVVDGSAGEGGGQILRSALALSILTRTPFKMERIRAGREKPGLLRQHLTAVRAAADVSSAEVKGAELGSRELVFKPRTVKGGERSFDIGSAGSATLVLSTVLPALMHAHEPSTIAVKGGTHNPAAPPFEFLTRSLMPLLARAGADVQLTLDRHGFYPAGGGRVSASVTPSSLGAIELEERGAQVRRKVTATVAGLNPQIADRELRVAKDRLGLSKAEMERVELPPEHGPGNVFSIELEFANVTAIFTAFGEKGLRAEQVAELAIGPSLRYLETRAAVCEHLADQLLLPMALGRGGVFTTVEPSSHTTTQIETLKLFLGGEVEVDTTDDKTFTVTMRGSLI